MRNYIGNNNEINKKKYKKSLPPKLNPDAGNVEHNIDMFNKASSGDANLSSAAGMNGMAESYDRDSLIARITEFGKHYNFDKYTDAQLNAMLNRLVDASNHRKKVLPEYQDRIDVQSERHIMNDDPSYNFDDPEREGEYRVENLREALNRLDHYCIDNDKRFYDLRSLYEGIKYQLTPEEKQELKRLVDTTNDPDAVKAYIDSKDPQKKNEELDESIIKEELNATDFVDWMWENFPEWQYADEESFGDDIVQITFFNRDAKYNKKNDDYTTLLTALDKQGIESYYLSQSNHLLQVTLKEYDTTAFNDSDIEFTDIDFDESLNEGALDNLKARRQARLDKIDAKKRAADPLYDKMRSWEEKEQHKDDPIYNFVYDQKFKYSGSKYGVTQVPKNVVSAIIKNNAESISSDAFKDCTKLKEVKFENKIIMIGKRAFMNCTSLTNMELPETVHTIEDEAFKGCSNLQHLVIPNKKVRIGQNVFEGCTRLQKNKNESLKFKNKYNEAINSNYRVDTWIDNKDKITPSKLKKEISSYPEGTYLRLCRKGAINAMNQYTYGFVKVEPDQWVAYSSIVGLSNNTPRTDYEILQLVSKYNIKNIGVKISKSFSDNSMVVADWEDSTDLDFDESLKLKKKRR